VLTCEHASAALPLAYGRLGLSEAALRSHAAWDRGAAAVARRVANSLGCAYVEGRWSRLLIDLNRSESHPRLVPRRAFDLDVPGNAAVSSKERQRRLVRYWLPHRRAVSDAIARVLARHDVCLHVAVHSFVPVLSGRRRDCDVGLLFDPARAIERVFASNMRVMLRACGLKTRFNYPYRGTSDGLTKELRGRLPAARYAGIELELNQTRSVNRQRQESSARLVAAVLAAISGKLDDDQPGMRQKGPQVKIGASCAPSSFLTEYSLPRGGYAPVNRTWMRPKKRETKR
jgi:predicted N-formylglutamate amidohydrolase